eukprot:947087-Ditylum_brightwellii.AAC.1
MVLYLYDANYIQGIPIKSRSAGEFERAYAEAYEMMKTKCYKPKLHKLDNESSRELKAWIERQQTTMQYTPPDMHRTNAAEKAESLPHRPCHLTSQVPHQFLVQLDTASKHYAQSNAAVSDQPCVVSTGSNAWRVSF